LRQDRYEAHATANCLKFPKLTTSQKSSDFGNLKSDIALIILNDDLKIPAVSIMGHRKTSTDLVLTHPSYGRDRPYLLVADTTCRILEVRKGLWLTNCDTNFGGSGGPVLVKQGNKLELAAIMVAVVKSKYSVAVPVSNIVPSLKSVNCP